MRPSFGSTSSLARGCVLPSQIRKGTYFTGRHGVLRDLIEWLDDHARDDARGRLVTGDPGAGKTAVLTHGIGSGLRMERAAIYKIACR